MESRPKSASDRQSLELFQAAELLLEECRMVLPGIQGLFGFQLIAVFSDGFHSRLQPFEQDLHLIAIALIGVAIALIMAPAATHRQCDPYTVTRAFIELSTQLLLWSMLPLALGLCLDFYLVARVIVGTTLGLWAALGILVTFFALWWVLPRQIRTRAGDPPPAA